MDKLNVFVGSSSEAKNIDVQIRKFIEENDANAISWRKIFTPGEFGLESLLNISNEIDAAILIASPDDKTWYRGNNTLTPRDNIIFEIGLFIRALGRERVSIVLVRNEKGEMPRLPTDLSGLNLIIYDVNKSAVVEQTLSKWIDDSNKISSTTSQIFDDTFEIIKDNLCRIPSTWRNEINNFILSPFKRATINAIRGEIDLTPGQYYQSLYSEMSEADNNMEIRAISMLSSEIWREDEHQKKYLDFNINAANKGAVIKRLFVVSDEKLSDLKNIIVNHKKNNIEIKVISPKLFVDQIELKDSVIIKEDNKIRSYISLRYFDNSTRLRGGKLIINSDECREQINSFERAWKIAIKPTYEKDSKKVKIFPQVPPGERYKSIKLNKPVVSCEQAAKERGVPLENELKTLILYAKSGFVAAHLPGDGVLSLRKIKNALEIEDVCLADPEDLIKMNLTAGTVSAVLNPVWSMPHLISKRILTMDYVTTNNGTKTGYYKFDPWTLMKAENTLVDDYEK